MHVHRIGMSVLAELGATDPIEAAAPKGLKNFNAAQRHAERSECRRYIIADPVRDCVCHRTLQRYHRRENRPVTTRKTTAFTLTTSVAAHSPGPVIGGIDLNSAISDSCPCQCERSE